MYIFFKFVIFVKADHCYCSPHLSKNLATPLYFGVLKFTMLTTHTVYM
jgi:hypothetical protein